MLADWGQEVDEWKHRFEECLRNAQTDVKDLSKAARGDEQGRTYYMYSLHSFSSVQRSVFLVSEVVWTIT